MRLPGALSDFDCKDVHRVLARVNDRHFHPPDEEIVELHRIWEILLEENYVVPGKEVTVSDDEGEHRHQQWGRTQAGHRLLDRINNNCLFDE
jgi:hypothetical protein